METTKSGNAIVFIHGLFSTPSIWSDWIEFFKKKRYSCHSPAYPFHQGHPADLRRSIDPSLGKLTFGQVARSLIEFIEKLPDKPILVGHSMGGLVVQKLIEANRGIAGICIDPAPPQGITSYKWSFLKSVFPMINPFKGNSVFLPSVKRFNYACCNTLTLGQTQVEYDKVVVPSSRNIPRSANSSEGKIDFKKPHNPLLFIAGELDHIIPSSLNKKNFDAYTDKAIKIPFKEFKNVP
jgi:pimeloyl-ACP methyl ester carboxylesterase